MTAIAPGTTTAVNDADAVIVVGPDGKPLGGTGATGVIPVGGNVASGATDSGNGVKTAGRYNATLPTIADGQRADTQADASGNTRARLAATATTQTDTWPTNNIAAVTGSNEADSARLLLNGNMTFTGSAWASMRGDAVATSVLPGLSSTFWGYAAANLGIVNTTAAVTVKAAAGASVRNYISGIDLSWDSLTNATEFCIRDGASGTVLWRHKIPNGAAGRFDRTFAVPLRGTANTLVEVVTLSASGAGGVFANLQGFTGA